MTFEVRIGKYQCPEFTELNNKDAYGFYDFSKSLFALAPSNLESEAAMVLEAIILQLLNQCPLKGMEVYLFQTIASDKFKSIKRIYAATQKSMGQQFFSDNEATNYLKNLSEQVNRRYADFASAQVQNIFEYNRKYRTVKPLIFYIIDNAELILENANLISPLCNIIDQGSKAGIYLVLQYNDDNYKKSHKYHNQDDKYYQLLNSELSKMFGINLYSSNEIFINLDYHYNKFIQDLGYQPAFSPNHNNDLADTFLRKLNANHNQHGEVDFIKVKIGEYQNHDAHFAIGPASMSYYTLIAGGSGSGKSILLTDIILSICEQYSPEEVQLLLVDFAGVTFNLLENSIAHIPYTILSTSDTNKLNGLFDYIEKEGHRRNQLFMELSNKLGKKVDNITTYRKLSGKKLPVIMLFFDELQKLFFIEDSNLTQKSSRFFNTIANEVRKYGIFIVLSTQSYSNITNKLSDYFSNSNVRIGLKPNDRYDFVALMGQSNDGYKQINNTPNQRQLIFNDRSGDPSANILVVNNYMTDDIVNHRLSKLKKAYPKNNDISDNIYQGICDAIVNYSKPDINFTNDHDNNQPQAIQSKSTDDMSFDELSDSFLK